MSLENARLLARLEARSDGDLVRRLSQLDALWEVVVVANRPTVLPVKAAAELSRAASETYLDLRGEERPLFTVSELACLSIPRGSLSPAERKEIESHVTHTFHFLRQIPWTRSLRRVPEIAYGHHEKLDGHGYPRAVSGESIPLEARIMTIADIYDALTAADRPYKRALPSEKALDILEEDARHGQIDPALFRVFVEAGVYRGTKRP